MRLPPALVRASVPQSDSLLGLLALATRICRLAADIENIDRLAGQARIVGSSAQSSSRRSHDSSTSSPPVYDFLCPTSAPPASDKRNGSSTTFGCIRRLATGTHRVSISRISPARSRPHLAPASTRYASTASAVAAVPPASNLSDSHAQHYADSLIHPTDDPAWQQSSHLAAQPNAPSSDPNARPKHWDRAWQTVQSSTPADRKLDRKLDRLIADCTAQFERDWEERGQVSGRTSRTLSAHRLWRFYQQNAHKEALLLSTRVLLALTIADLTNKITTNKASFTKFKVLRYLFGLRIRAIFQDCQIYIANTQASASTLAHTNLTIALLEPISSALHAQPMVAFKLLDEVLIRCRPDIYKYKTDSELPHDYLSPINLALLTIIDSINFEIHCQPQPNKLVRSMRRRPEYYQDTEMLISTEHAEFEPAESSDPILDSLRWVIASPHAFMLSHPSCRPARISFLHCLSQTEDPHRVLDELAQDRDPLEPALMVACDLLLRSVLIHKGTTAALDLNDDLWSRGIPISPMLTSRLIKESTGQSPSARLEAIFHRAMHANRLARGRDRVGTQVLRRVTMGWAARNRADRVEVLLSELKHRNASTHETFARLVMIELAAARGDVRSLHEKLAEIYDFEARHVDECQAGKVPLNGKAYNLLLKSCNRSDDVDLAEYYLTQALERGIAPRSSEFNLLIDLHVRKSNVDAALAIFEQMKEFGVQPDKYTYTILIHGFALRRDPDSAAHALRAMIAARKTPDRITYAALLNCFVESGLYPAAIRLFSWMRSHRDVRLRPTIEICNIILKAYVLSSLPVQKVMQFVDNVRRLRLVPNANTYALMLQSACDAGLMDVAEEVFSEAERALPSVTGQGPGHGANLYHFTIMIHGYLRLGDHKEAKDYFDEMQSRKLSPTSITWAVMVNSYANSENEANYELACTLVSQLVADESKKTFRPSSWSQTANRAEKGKVQSAGVKVGLTSKFPAKNSPPFDTLYTVLMVAQARRGEPEMVEKTLKLLARSSSGLSVPAMTPLLDAYRRAGDVGSALRLFDQIYETALEVASSQSHRVYAHNRTDLDKDAGGAVNLPASEQRRRDASSRNILCLPVSIMIDLLSSAGRHEEVAKIWSRAKKDGFGFDSDNWNHLAASMARAGQLDEALSVVEHVLYREPPNAWMSFRLRENAGKLSNPSAVEDADTEKRAIHDEAVPAEAGNSDATLPKAEEFDPLPADSGLDPATAHRSDAASPPSSPPNRRHQTRLDDDPYTELPFARNTSKLSLEQDDLDFEEDTAIEEEFDPEEDTESGAFYLDENSGISLTRELESKAEGFSLWYAHFETMEAISRGLAEVRESHKVISLLDKHPIAANLLDLHERKVEIIRERQKEEAMRSARDLIDGRA